MQLKLAYHFLGIFLLLAPAGIRANEEKLFSMKEAYRESADKIVILSGIRNELLRKITLSMNRNGYPTTLLPGEPNVQVTLFVGRSRPWEIEWERVEDYSFLAQAGTLYRTRVGPPIKMEYSIEEAYLSSSKAIVLHYGDNWTEAVFIAEALESDGYKVSALPSELLEGLTLFVDRSIPIVYSNLGDLTSGAVGAHATKLYNDKVGEDKSTNMTETKIVSKFFKYQLRVEDQENFEEIKNMVRRSLRENSQLTLKQIDLQKNNLGVRDRSEHVDYGKIEWDVRRNDEEMESFINSYISLKNNPSVNNIHSSVNKLIIELSENALFRLSLNEDTANVIAKYSKNE